MLEGFSYVISQGLFLKSIAFVYLIAFASLKVQVMGLYGSHGIQPINEYLTLIKTRYKKWDIYFKLPTLFWFHASDRSLNLACWAGLLISLLAIAGVQPAICLFFLFILYYSFLSVGAPFLNYQWDILLLEGGILAFLLAIQSPPPLLLIYLLWFLLFRFMFSSGATKLMHGSKEWKDLTAMDFHYETQPLPTRWAYYAHQQPKFLARLSVLGVYFFELIVPFFIFSPPPIRMIAFFLLVLFQILIMLTGNFAFFNLLTIVLCIPLLPDSYLLPFQDFASFTPLVQNNPLVTLLLTAIAAYFLLLNVLELLTIFIPVGNIYRILSPFREYHLINSYGLFVHMTTWRDEIVIEGSNDGVEWKNYTFKWKPGRLDQVPKIVAPHQPRLDWQMWFASLGSYQGNRWYMQFIYRLLEGSEDVLKLLQSNPFPEKPPKYIRSTLFRYHFTDLKFGKATGHWWIREYLGSYAPLISLSEEKNIFTLY